MPRVAPWWGAGRAPWLEWPGVTLPLEAVWRAPAKRWESPDGAFYFDRGEADRACDFFPALLRHHIGAFAGQPFTLLPYQTKLLTRPIFGWKRSSDGLRRFRKVFAFLPKGAGKSPWAAGTGLYLLFCDREPAAEVYALATDKLQARTVHDNAKIMVEDSPALAKRAQVLKDAIAFPGARGTYQVLSSEAPAAHGKRPHGVILDEFHTQRSRDLFEALRKSLAKRRQPLLILITHAGDDDESICFEEYEFAKRVLAGDAGDAADTLPVIFEAAPADDWQDPATWRKVNPGHGITIQHEGVASEAREAALEPRKRNDFLRFHCNRWTNQAVAWIPVDWWDAQAAPLPPAAQLVEAPVAVGIDLAQKYDLAAAVAVFQVPLEASEAPVEIAGVEEGDPDTPGEPGRPSSLTLNYRLAWLPMFWLPEATLSERVAQDRVPYDLWRDQGLLRVTPGAVIDFEAIRRYLVDELTPAFPRLKGAEIAYDPAFATELALRLQGDGYTTIELLQNYKYFTEPCLAFEALVRAGRILHGGHRLLRWNLENVAIKRDDAGRIRPVKPGKAAKRIDGIVAGLMGMARLLVQTTPAPAPSYDLVILGGSP